MFLARAEDGRRITSTRDEQGYCPKCNDPLVAKQGDVYEWHWAHRPGKSCDYRAGTSRWHYKWLNHYHSLDGWEVEPDETVLKCDALNNAQKKAVLLMSKYDLAQATSFIQSAREAGYAPSIILNSQCIKSLQFSENRFKQIRRSDMTYVMFCRFSSTRPGKKLASFWLDVEERTPLIGLSAGLHRLTHDDEYWNDVVVDPAPLPVPRKASE
ncbi:competence protein CoiA family protein [Marinobacter sp.]|uniref:competence protein CoiA family protein n=1 Tax=Marinobacter sp. TaxID=50741 RepID=UPI003A945D59